jgi:hypothetical protein
LPGAQIYNASRRITNQRIPRKALPALLDDLRVNVMAPIPEVAHPSRHAEAAEALQGIERGQWASLKRREDGVGLGHFAFFLRWYARHRQELPQYFATGEMVLNVSPQVSHFTVRWGRDRLIFRAAFASLMSCSKKMWGLAVPSRRIILSRIAIVNPCLSLYSPNFKQETHHALTATPTRLAAMGAHPRPAAL